MGTVVKEYTFIDLDVQGDISVTGKVDGVDVSDHAADTAIHHAHNNTVNLNLVDQNVGTAASPAFKGLTVSGDIAVTGKVDGVDVSAHAADASIHTIAANKTYLDTIDQGLGKTYSPAFAGLSVNGDLAVTGKVDGVDVSVHAADASIHHTHANKANIDIINQNLGSANAPAFAGLTVNGNLAVTGTVDGVDISVHAANSTIHHTHTNKTNLDTVNQNLGTANTPAFAGLTVNGNVAVTGTVDGVDVSAHAARHQSGGADALTGILDANARVQVKVGNTAVGSRRTVNFVAGNGVVLAAVDNPANESVDVTISSVGSTQTSSIQEMVTGVAGEALAAFDLCYLNADGKYYKTNSLTLATMPGLVLAGAAFTTGQSGNFIRRGQVTNSNWAWATVGGFVYAGNTAGAMTQTIPSTSREQLQIAGLATGATRIDFDPQLVLVEVA